MGVGEATVGGGGLGGGSFLRGGRDGELGAWGALVDVGESACDGAVVWCTGAAGAELSKFILDSPLVKSLRSSSFSVRRAKQKSETWNDSDVIN